MVDMQAERRRPGISKSFLLNTISNTPLRCRSHESLQHTSIPSQYSHESQGLMLHVTSVSSSQQHTLGDPVHPGQGSGHRAHVVLSMHRGVPGT
jgi:hypothetical protein